MTLATAASIRTAILVGNDLGPVVDGISNRAVRVAKRDSDHHPVRGFGTGLDAPAVTHSARESNEKGRRQRVQFGEFRGLLPRLGVVLLAEERLCSL